jgi:D-apionolactonase
MRLRYESGRLRYIRVDGAEVLRHVYMAVRDRHWNTVPGRIVDEQVKIAGDGFSIEIAVEHRQDDIDFRWRGTLRGAGNRIEVEMDGQAHSPFARNRIGWCVLHPTRETVGRRCTVLHVDGSSEASAFPERISPHQPFLDIKALSWSPAPGLHAKVEFEGDVFETEDQRNWTDDSFKTYSTPLRLPFPVRLNAGDRVRQRVVLTVAERPSIRVTDKRVAFPQLGLMNATATGFSHSRIDLPSGRVLNDAPLEVVVHVRERRDLEAAKAAVGERAVARWIVFDAGKPATTAETIAMAREVLGGSAPIGGGADTNFTELNRNRAVAAAADFVAFSCNPQAHASDELSIVENLLSIAAAVESARIIAAGKPVVISTLMFKRRFNPHAPDLPEPPDPRERQPIAAAWLVGALKYAAEAGVESISLSPTTGAETLRRITTFRPTHVQQTECSAPMQAVALALWRGSERLLLVANLTDSPAEVDVDERTVRLGPWEVAEA